MKKIELKTICECGNPIENPLRYLKCYVCIMSFLNNITDKEMFSDETIQNETERLSNKRWDLFIQEHEVLK